MKAEFIRDLCLGFRDETEEVKWDNNLCFLIRDKMFCITGIEGDFGVSFKVKDEQLEELLGRIDIVPAPYLGRYKWILVKSAAALRPMEWKFYLQQSFNLIRTKAEVKTKGKKGVWFF